MVIRLFVLYQKSIASFIVSTNQKNVKRIKISTTKNDVKQTPSPRLKKYRRSTFIKNHATAPWQDEEGSTHDASTSCKWNRITKLRYQVQNNMMN